MSLPLRPDQTPGLARAACRSTISYVDLFINIDKCSIAVYATSTVKRKRKGAHRLMSDKAPTAFVSGLEDVVAAETRLSSVDGEAGELIVAGFPVEEFARRASFEETVYLLWHGALPNPEQLSGF